MATWKDGAADRLSNLNARIAQLQSEIEELDERLLPLRKEKFNKGELLEKLKARADALGKIMDEED